MIHTSAGVPVYVEYADNYQDLRERFRPTVERFRRQLQIAEEMILTHIFHKLPAASAQSAAFAGRNGQSPLRSVSTQLHRALAISARACSTPHALATKVYEICGLGDG